MKIIHVNTKFKLQKNKIEIQLCMKGYIKAALKKFIHPTPSTPQHAPHDWKPPAYGRKIQH